MKKYILPFLTCCFFLACRSGDTPADTKAAVDGPKIFRQNCVVCHGADGKLQLNGAKDLSISVLPLEERINQVTNGKNLMTPFKGILSPEEIKAVAEYTLSLKTE
jgi:mono/diheme cytochrome c family protein